MVFYQYGVAQPIIKHQNRAGTDINGEERQEQSKQVFDLLSAVFKTLTCLMIHSAEEGATN
ncbi:hypothetical protein OLMES_3790 [Oleiphilus messinensis]|uniref:Uncharacterized protein n=1 Tax=Oleiphilus messinensis TaxID=141451 RepID=A0A1Y0IC37_9GAMM|nr:hypothetical protein [Oleiphilus messinensis]ARU57810.1 hypothetical protein OLMES_3790 [Oleiphilus messinensis]